MEGVGREDMQGLLEAQLRVAVPAITRPILAELAAVRALAGCGRCERRALVDWGWARLSTGGK